MEERARALQYHRLHNAARALCLSRGVPRGADAWSGNYYDACPLCAHGEAGAEHLLSWCPAVALAWGGWGRATAAAADATGRSGGSGVLGPSLITALLQAQGDVEYLAVFLHQVAFLRAALLGRASMDSDRAADWLIRACGATSAGGQDGDDDDEPHRPRRRRWA